MTSFSDQTDFDYVDIKNDPYWRSRFEELQDKIQGKSDRLISNYSRENLKLDEHVGFYGMVYHNEIVSFFGVYRREWWPDGAFRVGNRYYVCEEFRSESVHVHRNSRVGLLFTYGFDILEECARIHGAKLIFVSRQAFKTGKNHFRKAMHKEVLKVRPEWQFEEDYFRVAEGDSAGSWQRFMFKELEDGSKELLDEFPRITTEEFLERYEGRF